MNNFLSRIPPVVKNLILLNLVMLVLTYITRGSMIERFALFYPASPFFKPYQILSHMFMHGNFFHLFFNMWSLWMFGSVLERVWGSKRFFLFYMICGLGAAALHTGVEWIQAHQWLQQIEAGSTTAYAAYRALLSTPTVGASGAIYGVFLGYGMLFPNNVLTMVFPPISLKAKWFVIICVAIELFLGISGAQAGVAHFAHLGGALFGFILIKIWQRKGNVYY